MSNACHIRCDGRPQGGVIIVTAYVTAVLQELRAHLSQGLPVQEVTESFSSVPLDDPLPPTLTAEFIHVLWIGGDGYRGGREGVNE